MEIGEIAKIKDFKSWDRNYVIIDVNPETKHEPILKEILKYIERVEDLTDDFIGFLDTLGGIYDADIIVRTKFKGTFYSVRKK